MKMTANILRGFIWGSSAQVKCSGEKVLGVLSLAFKFTAALLDNHPLSVICKSCAANAGSVCCNAFAAFDRIHCEPCDLAHCCLISPRRLCCQHKWVSWKLLSRFARLAAPSYSCSREWCFSQFRDEKLLQHLRSQI